MFLFTFIFCLNLATAHSKVLMGDKYVHLSNHIDKTLIENALTFINSYVNNCNKMEKSIDILDWVYSSNLTTKSFKVQLQKILTESSKVDSEMGLGFDPIFNAQDYPNKGFELDSVNYKSNYIVVKGENWSDFKLIIKMLNINNKWLVDGCGIINTPKE